MVVADKADGQRQPRSVVAVRQVEDLPQVGQFGPRWNIEHAHGLIHRPRQSILRWPGIDEEPGRVLAALQRAIDGPGRQCGLKRQPDLKRHRAALAIAEVDEGLNAIPRLASRQ